MPPHDLIGLSRRQMLTGSAALLAAGACSGAGEPSQTPAAAAPGWRAAPPLPLAVQEIYPAVHDGRIHLAGGLYAEGGQIRGATRTHVSWAPGEEVWREEGALPAPCHHPNLVSTGAGLLALGGFTTREEDGVLDWTMSAQTLIYDPAAATWRAGPPAPEPHGETVCVALDGMVHVIGGRTPKGTENITWTDHIDSDRHLILDPATGAWQRAAPALTQRNSAAGVRLGGAIHVVGGRRVEGGNLTDHEVWDGREDRWRAAAPMPQVVGGGQGGLAAAVIGGQLVALGGEYFSDGGGVYHQVWVYDPARDDWQAGPDMLTPRHGLGAVSLEGALYALGGATGPGGNGTSRVVEALSL